MLLANGTVWNQQLYSRKHRRLMNAEDTAQLLGVTRRTICRWQKQGKMPERVPHRGRMLYRQDDIEEMARSHPSHHEETTNE
jgi:predicted DNA-binding transcriptional regulator AlpA